MFPPPKASEETVQSFGFHVLVVPVIIVIVGLLLSSCLFCCLCCGRCSDRRGRPQKPSSKPVFCFALMTFAAIIIGSLACWSTGGSSYDLARIQFDRGLSDLQSAEAQGKNLNRTGNDMISNLRALYMPPKPLCQNPLLAAKVKEDIAPTVSQIQDSLTPISQFTVQIGSMIKKLDYLRNQSGFTPTVAATGMALPMVLIGASCIVIVFAVLFTRGFGGSGMAKCNDCCFIRLGSIFITLSVLIATVVAASQCALGIATASLCNDVDEVVLLYANSTFGDNSTLYGATNYYLTGKGTNPLNETLAHGKEMIGQASTAFSGIESDYGSFIKDNCQGWTGSAVTQDFQDIKPQIDVVLNLISRNNIYPYYNEVINKDLCDTALAGLGWIIVCQLVVGLFCLPVIAVMSASFFSRWAVWQEMVGERLLANPDAVMGSQVEVPQTS